MIILFVCDRVNSQSDPDIILVKNLLPFLAKENKVYFMGHDTDRSRQSEFCFVYKLDERVRELYFSLTGLSPLKKILRLISHPFLGFFGLFKVFNIDLIDLQYRKNIERICAKYGIDAAISVSAPFYTAKGLGKARVSAKKIVMMFDPYDDHYIWGNKRTKRQQAAFFNSADKVFVSPILKERYKNNDKVTAFDFPAVKPIEAKRDESLFDPSRLNLAFVGSLYADIRSPKFLYELLSKLGDPKIHLTIVGGVYGEFPDGFERDFAELLDNHVTIVGKVSKERADEYMANADILVNIGNLVENQLPSKVFDYISTGKPVLNLTQLKSCPSVPYFERYGNSLTVCQSDGITGEVIKRVNKFIRERKVLPFESVKEKFIEATPEFVAGQLNDCFK